jgi:hypothetical protein
MSNVVQFLEALSRDPKNLTAEDFAEAVAAANFDPTTREALLKRDPAVLNRLLGGRATVLAFVFPAENEPDGDQKEGDTPPDDGQEELPQHGNENAIAA